MEEVSRYETKDGKLFTTKSKAEAYERELLEYEHLELELTPRPDNTEFSNGAGYIQHCELRVPDVKKCALEVLLTCHPNLQKYITVPLEEVNPFGILGRILDDMDSPIRTLWYRFMCIDKYFREWGQPYYAINPGTGKQIELSK